MRLPVLLLLWMLYVHLEGLNIQNCRVNPETDEFNSVGSNEDFSVNCNFDRAIDTCTLIHFSPHRESISSNDKPDHNCPVSKSRARSGMSQDSCHQRISGRISGSSCTFIVQATEPEDSGEWKMGAVVFDNKANVESQSRSWEIFTYNQSYVELQNEDSNKVDNFNTQYNWDDREDDWVEGRRGYETVEFRCLAAGGRPRPSFKWYMERNYDEIKNDELFDVSDEYGQVLRSYGDNGIIKDVESSIRFKINDELLERLQRSNVDTNPEQGDFSFELTCEVYQSERSSLQQGGIRNRETVKINVEKLYDNGRLKTSAIGIIVGVVAGVILLVAAIVLILVAKSRRECCFSDDYDHPGDRRRESQGGIPPNQQQRHQHRR